METVYEERAKVFKALCDERRQRILELLHGGEKCACVLIDEMGMPQSSLSYHMKILCDSGIVISREEGKWTHYQISRQGSEKAIELLKQITAVEENSSGCQSCCK
ncbi:MAG: metalloregulator ArsR/SmtB family transcription factor [Lachnospiraceae bacterium]|nr:metalloregulator ArsR/SmtB family transcription factor [Lachnospiraceae bacterium]MDD7025055.1 metalloregulator ArsR/SmtB family transcription factor [Oscillospiraceae bacterium]